MGRTKPAHDETASAQVYHSVVTETQYTAQKMDLRSVISKSLGQHDESHLPGYIPHVKNEMKMGTEIHS